MVKHKKAKGRRHEDDEDDDREEEIDNEEDQEDPEIEDSEGLRALDEIVAIHRPIKEICGSGLCQGIQGIRGQGASKCKIACAMPGPGSPELKPSGWMRSALTIN